MAQSPPGREGTDPHALLNVVYAGAGVVVAIVSAVFAYLTFIQPSGAGDGPSQPNPAAIVTAPATGTGPTAATGVRPLTDLSTVTGATNVDRPADTSGQLDIRCPSGQTDDRARDVTYDLVQAYSGFSASASVSGPIGDDDKTQVELLADNVLKDNDIFTSAQTAVLQADDLGSVRNLTIRVICQNPRGVVHIRTANVTRL